MDLIENGNFLDGVDRWFGQSGTVDPDKLISANNKIWLPIPGNQGQAAATVRQLMSNPTPSWGQIFKFSITCKATPTGGVLSGAANQDNDANRLSTRVIFEFSVGAASYVMFEDIPVKETTYSHTFFLEYADPPSFPPFLEILNWPTPDMAEVLITGVSLETSNSLSIPESGDAETITVDLPAITLSPKKAIRIKKA